MFYNFQTNEMIEMNYKSIIDALSKLTMKETLTEMNDWVTHLSAVLFADQTTVKKSMRMSSFQMIYREKAVLSIELDVSTWQMLSWKTVQSTDNLMTMWARQIERHDADIKEVKTHLQHMWIQDKEQYDKMKKLITKSLKKNDLVLLHDSKLKMSHSVKLKFHWTESYCVWKVIEKKETYFLEKLDKTFIKNYFHENWVKKFWAHDKLMYMSIEEKNESNNETECLNQEKQQNNKNKAWWISSEQNFAVII